MSGAEFVVVLSVAASALQVMEAGGAILRKIKDYRSNISAFRHLEDQLPLLIQDIKALADTISNGSVKESSAQALSRVLEGCSFQLAKLDTLIDSVALGKSSSNTNKFFRAIRSYRKESTIRDAMGVLAQYQNTITMHLSAQAVFLQGDNAKAATPTPAPLSVLPSYRLSHFVGRTDILDKLSHIFAQTPTAKPNIAVLRGIGGQGKTQIALEFCHRVSAKGATVLWVDASSLDATNRCFEKFANEISEGQIDLSDPAALVRYVHKELRRRMEPFAIVFDNYDDPSRFEGRELSGFFPKPCPNTGNIVLVTSRLRETERLGTSFHVDGLEERAAIELLLKRADMNEDKCSSEELKSAQQVVKTLGYLALAIDQAAAFIRHRCLSLDAFMRIYENRKDRVLSETPKIAWEYRKEDGYGLGLRALSVCTTWELSLSQLPIENRDKIQGFLTQAAYLNHFNISEELFKTMVESISKNEIPEFDWISIFICLDGWDSFNFQEAVATLVNLSLVQNMAYSDGSISFALHPLIKVGLSFHDSESL